MWKDKVWSVQVELWPKWLAWHIVFCIVSQLPESIIFSVRILLFFSVNGKENLTSACRIAHNVHRGVLNNSAMKWKYSSGSLIMPVCHTNNTPGEEVRYAYGTQDLPWRKKGIFLLNTWCVYTCKYYDIMCILIPIKCIHCAVRWYVCIHVYPPPLLICPL